MAERCMSSRLQTRGGEPCASPYSTLQPPTWLSLAGSPALSLERFGETKLQMIWCGVERSLMAARNFPGEPFPWNEADRMFTLLVKRAAELAHCPPGSGEEEEFDRLASAIEAYEAKRWSQAKDSARLKHARK